MPPLAASLSRRPFAIASIPSTLRGQKLSISEEVAIAHRAGYQGIEPWIDELDRLVASGGSLSDLRKQIADAGMTVESAIGFAQWCVDDPAERKKGLEEARRTMGLVAAIGGTRIAAPPAGAKSKMDSGVLAERYAALLELGEQMGVVPIAEIWGPASTMNHLGEVAQIAIDSGHADACILPDIYHLYKGGSGYTGLALLGSRAVPVIAHERLSGRPWPRRNHRCGSGIIRAKAWRPGGRFGQLCERWALPAHCRWSCSTATIGNKIR